MLRIIEGGFYSSAYEEVKKEIHALVKERKKVYLIVPEQQAVIAEKELLGELPEYAPLCFEVTNFTRLANTVYRNLGGISGEYADKGKEALIMWRTLTELSPFLSIITGNEINSGMVEKALSAVAEMKSISATPEELASLAENESIKANARLIDKLNDISKIMTLYNRLVEEKYANAGDECEKLAEKLSLNPDFFRECHMFVSGFTSFTEPQYKVLSELMKSSRLSVHLVISKLTSDFFEFSEIKKTRERILHLADRAGIEKKLVRSEAKISGISPLLSEACSLLWRNFGKIDNDSLQNPSEELRIFEACDPYEECDFIASDIKRRLMRGALQKDFAIVARDAEKYSGIIDASLDAAGISYFISKRKDIYSYEAVKLIFTAYSAIESGFEREDVISYAKCGLSGISREACDEFELYTDVWQITKLRFTDGIFWNMNPDGYSTRRSAQTDEMLLRIDKTRHTVIDPLVCFGEEIREAKTVREHALALVKFLTDIGLEAKIEEQSINLYKLSETEAAKENEGLWKIICDSLDSVVEVLGENEINTRGFLSQLKVILSEADIGRIPAFSDEVTVGSADMLRLSDKKHVYIIGVNNGEFPRSAPSSSYFSERDKSVLLNLGLCADADTDIPYARELFFFSRAFASAKESVTLSYSVRSEALGSVSKADVIDRISSMTENKITPVKIADIPCLDKIYFPSMALEFIGREDVRDALCDSGFAREVEISSGSIENSSCSLNSDTAKIIYPGDIALTQTRIESYVNCPFAYYLKYNIKLSENERAGFDSRNIGTFIHAILENFFAELSERGESTADVTEEKKQDMVERAAKKYLSEIIDSNSPEKKRTEVLLDRLCRAAMPVVDGLCDELRGCDFVPRFFELKIGNEDENLPRPASFTIDEGNKAYVYGSIDRVDTYKHGDDVYVRVIDYKTGAKTFSPSDIDEGKNLQMFLYLKAIADTDNEAFRKRLGVGDKGQIIPAGVIYVKTDMSDVTIPKDDEAAERAEIEKKQERRGMLLDDIISISAMNKSYIPVKYKKNGEPDARTQKYLYTYDGWEELGEKISNKIGEVTSDMKCGNISLTSKTKDSPCEYCSFKPICRKG